MADSTFSLPAGNLPADVAQPTGLLHTLLTMSLTAVAVLRPVYDEADPATIRDFDWVLLNEVGQRMLQQPARPAASLLTLFPMAKADGVFAKCCRAFETGERQRNQTNYQADGLDGYFLLVAQRYENLLVVNFTDTNDQPRPAVEEALRASQAREQERAREAQALQADLLATAQGQAAEREAHRQLLDSIFQQAPVALFVATGPTYVLEVVNDLVAAVIGRSQQALVGRPYLRPSRS